MKKSVIALLGWCVVGVKFALAVALPAELADFDAYVARVQKEFNVPGIAVGIVKDGEVVLVKGYGVREMGKPEFVNEHTLFAIASNTKAFTSASLAILMDEKKLKWSDRVVDRLPWFQMSDAFVTREMTIQDLLVHRSGLALGAGDLLFWPATTYTTREVAERLRYVPLSTSFRSAYAYDNILYAVAGLTIEQVSGKTWSEFVRERIFGPVGMKETKTNCSELKPGDNVAIGHALFDFKDLKPVPAMAWDNNSAAGGIYSSVHDMTKWLNVQLAGGKLADGKALFSEARQKEMWSVVTPMPISQPSVAALVQTKPNFLGYGHGWILSDYRGKKLVSHTGGWPGQVSKVTLIPELKLGVVVLTNQEVGAAFQAVSWRVLDAFLGATPTDWVAAYVEYLKKSGGDADENWAKHVAARDAQSRPSLALAKYAGIYRDVWYGDVELSEKDGKLVMQFSKTEQLLGDLEHWQHNTFIVRWRDRSLNADAFVTFALTPDGAVESAKMEAVSPLTDFSFDFHDLKLQRLEK
ncbi:serine hydrolase [Oleiharenicola lentus]|uniref:serine hydrolase n=1 Tax=Oleiharenicola lentus TaxID=2508720 RepID=UPI003F675635